MGEATAWIPEGQRHEMLMNIPIAFALPINLRTMDAPRLSRFRYALRPTLQGGGHVLIVVVLTILSGGCASNYGPRPDLSTVETVGVVLPEESSEPLEADDVLRLYNRTKGEDTAKNSAIGLGAGVATGIAAGAAAVCLIFQPCGSAIVYFLPAIAISAGVVGVTAGAVTGSTVDTQEQVEVAPVHRHKTNEVLPSLQRDYLTRSTLEKRVPRLVRQQHPTIDFESAVRDGERYSLNDPVQRAPLHTDVNLILSDLHVVLAGKATDEPRVKLTVHTQWTLTNHDASSNNDSTWDILSGSYESKTHTLSEWLADEGALLKTHLNDGLEESLTGAFSELGGNVEREDWGEDWPVLSAEASF